MRFEDLQEAFGGAIHIGEHRMWLDTRIGGLRAFVVRRVVSLRAEKFEVAVFSPGTREFDPFRKPMIMIGRRFDRGSIPRLEPPFVYAGWWDGVVFAKSVDEPSLEEMINTLWRLVELARRPQPAPTVLKPMTRRERWQWEVRYFWNRWRDYLGPAFLLLCLIGAIASC